MDYFKWRLIKPFKGFENFDNPCKYSYINDAVKIIDTVHYNIKYITFIERHNGDINIF